MFIPTVDWLAWICIVSGAAWAIAGAILVGSRLRYDRRRRLLCTVEQLVGTESSESDEPPGDRQSEAKHLLSRAPLGDAVLLIRECGGSRRAAELLAESVLARIGSERLLEAAASRRKRDRWRRIIALRVLSFARSAERWPLLAAACANGTPEVKCAAVTLLGQLGDRRSATVLIDALRAGHYSRSRVAATLDAFAIDLGDLVAPLLEAPSAIVRFWGTALVRRYPQTPALAERLATLTIDADPRVRKGAVAAIGVTGADAAAAIAVRARLADDVGFVRAHAAHAITQLERSAAAQALLPLLADRDWTVRESAKQNLRTIGETVAPVLLPFLTQADMFARNSAAEVLQDIGAFDRLLVQELEGTTEPDRVRTLRLLARAGGPAMVASVIARLDPDLRPRANQLLAPTDREPFAKEVA